ncbi:hypothetical protein BP6252_04854 [Coleophoma cylindrospora]|uniref:RRM domain-containing protein n=1 Tax=Coleophoma cylindrospora TaxID=1849047 RepID=A0A3D8S1U1_9HELO|nr:hypothetical protein BP6252_04854 [Coleophoma cylindrospora]
MPVLQNGVPQGEDRKSIGSQAPPILSEVKRAPSSNYQRKGYSVLSDDPYAVVEPEHALFSGTNSESEGHGDNGPLTAQHLVNGYQADGSPIEQPLVNGYQADGSTSGHKDSSSDGTDGDSQESRSDNTAESNNIQGSSSSELIFPQSGYQAQQIQQDSNSEHPPSTASQHLANTASHNLLVDRPSSIVLVSGVEDIETTEPSRPTSPTARNRNRSHSLPADLTAAELFMSSVNTDDSFQTQIHLDWYRDFRNASSEPDLSAYNIDDEDQQAGPATQSTLNAESAEFVPSAALAHNSLAPAPFDQDSGSVSEPPIASADIQDSGFEHQVPIGIPVRSYDRYSGWRLRLRVTEDAVALSRLSNRNSTGGPQQMNTGYGELPYGSYNNANEYGTDYSNLRDQYFPHHQHQHRQSSRGSNENTTQRSRHSHPRAFQGASHSHQARVRNNNNPQHPPSNPPLPVDLQSYENSGQRLRSLQSSYNNYRSQLQSQADLRASSNTAVAGSGPSNQPFQPAHHQVQYGQGGPLAQPQPFQSFPHQLQHGQTDFVAQPQPTQPAPHQIQHGRTDFVAQPQATHPGPYQLQHDQTGLIAQPQATHPGPYQLQHGQTGLIAQPPGIPSAPYQGQNDQTGLIAQPPGIPSAPYQGQNDQTGFIAQPPGIPSAPYQAQHGQAGLGAQPHPTQPAPYQAQHDQTGLIAQLQDIQLAPHQPQHGHTDFIAQSQPIQPAPHHPHYGQVIQPQSVPSRLNQNQHGQTGPIAQSQPFQPTPYQPQYGQAQPAHSGPNQNRYGHTVPPGNLPPFQPHGQFGPLGQPQNIQGAPNQPLHGQIGPSGQRQPTMTAPASGVTSQFAHPEQPFGNAPPQQPQQPFGNVPQQPQQPFGNAPPHQPQLPFGNAPPQQPQQPFGNAPPHQPQQPFGNAPPHQPQQPFGNAPPHQPQQPFGNAPPHQPQQPFGNAPPHQPQQPYGNEPPHQPDLNRFQGHGHGAATGGFGNPHQPGPSQGHPSTPHQGSQNSAGYRDQGHGHGQRHGAAQGYGGARHPGQGNPTHGTPRAFSNLPPPPGPYGAPQENSTPQQNTHQGYGAQGHNTGNYNQGPPRRFGMGYDGNTSDYSRTDTPQFHAGNSGHRTSMPYNSGETTNPGSSASYSSNPQGSGHTSSGYAQDETPSKRSFRGNDYTVTSVFVPEMTPKSFKDIMDGADTKTSISDIAGKRIQITTPDSNTRKNEELTTRLTLSPGPNPYPLELEFLSEPRKTDRTPPLFRSIRGHPIGTEPRKGKNPTSNLLSKTPTPDSDEDTPKASRVISPPKMGLPVFPGPGSSSLTTIAEYDDPFTSKGPSTQVAASQTNIFQPLTAVSTPMHGTLMAPPYGMSRELAVFTRNGTYTPTAEEALDMNNMPFCELPRYAKAENWGVIKITNIPYNLTRAEVLAFLGRNAKVISEFDHEPVHIIMERVTSKTLECYVEFVDLDEALNAVARFESNRFSGRASKLGQRHVDVELSSQDALMRDLFPKAKNVFWKDGKPTIIPVDPNDVFNSGFKGFVTKEELVMLEKHVMTPARSPFSKDCPQRPYECMISTLLKFPWAMVDCYTIQDRIELHSCLKVLIQELGKNLERGVENVNINHMLMKRLVKAALVCPGFTPTQKDDVCLWVGATPDVAKQYGLPPYADLWAAIWTLAPKPGVPHDMVMWYLTKLNEVAKPETQISLADQAALSFDEKEVFDRERFGVGFLYEYEKINHRMLCQQLSHSEVEPHMIIKNTTVGVVARIEWATLEHTLRRALGGY